MNSTSNGPMSTISPSMTGHHLGATEQPGLLDAVAGEPERRARRRRSAAADRGGGRSRRCRAAGTGCRRHGPRARAWRPAGDPRGVVAQVREVGQHEVDAVHVGIGEHQPAVDEQDVAGIAAALLDRHAVAADLTQPAEEDDPHRLGHQRSIVDVGIGRRACYRPTCSGRSGNASRQRCRFASTSAPSRRRTPAPGPSAAGPGRRRCRGGASSPWSGSGWARRRRSRTRSSRASGC